MLQQTGRNDNSIAQHNTGTKYNEHKDIIFHT